MKNLAELYNEGKEDQMKSLMREIDQEQLRVKLEVALSQVYFIEEFLEIALEEIKVIKHWYRKEVVSHKVCK